MFMSLCANRGVKIICVERYRCDCGRHLRRPYSAFAFFTSRFTLPHQAGDQGTVARSYVRASVARVLSRGIAPAEFEGHGAALRGCGDNVTMPNRPALESGRSMTFHWHRRGRYIV